MIPYRLRWEAMNACAWWYLDPLETGQQTLVRKMALVR
jgi:hypothetical protein